MKSVVHASAGIVAFATILIFLTSTLAVELVGGAEAVTKVKLLIPWGFLLLIPALAVAGGSGFSFRRRGRKVDAKKRRMAIAAANGILVLVPAALFLAAKAQAQTFDAMFYAVQVLEFVAGTVNLALLGLNIRDGFAMTGRFRKRRKRGPADVPPTIPARP